MERKRCERCGRFLRKDCKPVRVVSTYTNDPFPVIGGGGYYGKWWLVDNAERYKAGFLQGIPMGPYGAEHSEHGNSTFIVERFVFLCKNCAEEDTFVLLDGCVSTCDNCRKKRYGAGNNFGHVCEDCLRDEMYRHNDFEYMREDLEIRCECIK